MDEEERLDPTLEELLCTDSIRWIFVGGKGGVGKTTTACSIAVQLSTRRETVLILSTDPAHNLSDAFGQKLTGQPTLVNDFKNLYAMEIDPAFQEVVQNRLQGADAFAKMIPEVMASLPGIDEAFSFAELMNSVQTMNYSVIVFDTAPTGHTLRLLAFPELLEKGLRKFSELKDKMSGAFGMLGTLTGQTGAEELVQAKLEQLQAVTTSVRETFQDPTKSTFVCVCIPEFLSLYETERLVQELAKQQIDCSNIIVNQVVFPIDDVEGVDIVVPPEFAEASVRETELRENLVAAKRKIDALESAHMARRRMQSKYLTQVQDLYCDDFHVIAVPIQPEEVRGTESLEAFGRFLLTKKSLPIVEEL